MKNRLRQVLGGLGYRLRVMPQTTDVPDHRLVELVEGPDRLTPGRALDLGCGTGRNAIYLAKHGWDVVGVDKIAYALKQAREAAGSLPVRFVEGDVTNLAELGIGTDFTLLIDVGCYHLVPAAQRGAYGESVTRVAAPGARLIIVTLENPANAPEHAVKMLERLGGWRLVDVGPVPAEHMCQYISGPAPLRKALADEALEAARFEFERQPD